MFYTFMWFIALLLLLLVDVVYVTSFIGGYYPEFEFFYWVVELVLLIHLIFLIKRRRTHGRNCFSSILLNVIFRRCAV